MAAISNVRSRLFAKVLWQSSLSLTSKTLASASQTSSQYCIDLVRWEYCSGISLSGHKELFDFFVHITAFLM